MMKTYYIYQKYYYADTGRAECFHVPLIFTPPEFLDFLQRELKLNVADYQNSFDENSDLGLRTGNYYHCFKRLVFGLEEEPITTTDTFIDLISN